jgi:hypothetical protein
MNNRLKVYNTLYRALDSQNLNLLYKPSNTFFDLIVPILDIGIHHYSSSDENNHNCDAYMTSSILEHNSIRGNILLNYGIPDIIGFHSLVPNRFKKEDLYILKQSCAQSYKIFFDNSISDSWSIKDRFSYNIGYGLPEINVSSDKNKKTIAIMNLNNNSNIATLYQYIKNVFKDSEMITDISSLKYSDLLNKLSGFHICLDHDTLINCIVASYAGCHIITSLSSIQGVNGSFNNMDYRSIMDLIRNIIPKVTESDKRVLLDAYSFDKFSSKFIKCLRDIKKAPVIP